MPKSIPLSSKTCQSPVSLCHSLKDCRPCIYRCPVSLTVYFSFGIKLATNIGGQYLGAPEPVNRQVMLQTPLAMQEYLSETTRAVTNMISRNVLAHYNNIKVVVPHCGAYLPSAIPRMKSLTPVMQANKMVGEIDWEANLPFIGYPRTLNAQNCIRSVEAEK